MSCFSVKMAGRVAQVESIYDRVMNYCNDYLTDEPADIFVKIQPSDIAYERKRSDSECLREGRPVIYYPEDHLEELAVYRKICEKMPDHDTFLFHGSAIAVEGQAFLFTAKSGTGKSTHTRLWRQYLGEKAVMVNDDKPLIRITDEGAFVCGTPYCGKHGIGSNITVPLKAVCILTRSEENWIRKADVSEIRPMLLQQSYRPADPIQLMKTLDLIDRLTESVSLYILGCNMDISAAETAYNGMKN
ncbi:MAG TPA: hypothetical protein PLH83_04085 [Ruminococcus sp.]|nr:hypothetical protein [Ruminococcus sp.]